MQNPRATSKQPKHSDPDAAFISANIHDPEAAARLTLRILTLKRLLQTISKKS